METESPVLSYVIGAQRVGAAGAWPDQRLNHRISAIIADALNPPNASILQATGGDAGQAKGTYRFYQNTRVTDVDLNAGIGRETAERCLKQGVILAVHATAPLNLTGLRVVMEWGPQDGRSAARGLYLQKGWDARSPDMMAGITGTEFARRWLPCRRPRGSATPGINMGNGQLDGGVRGWG